MPSGLAAVLFIFAAPAISKPKSIIVEANPVVFDTLDPARTGFGRLQWRGGLVLSSDYKKFGGFSGLVLSKNGRKMVAVSDRGKWMSARLNYKDGNLTGIENVRIGPLLNKKSRPFRGKGWRDSEAIASLNGRGDLSELLVSFERKHRILEYSYGARGLRARARRIKTPRAIKKLDYNKGIEAIAVFDKKTPHKGAVIIFGERPADAKRNIKGWILGGKYKGTLSVLRRNAFDVTDADTLPNGDLLILERKMTLMGGPRFRIRRIASADIRPGAILDGEVLIDAGLRNTIDNMEGLAVHQTPEGEWRITLISDDNFSIIQRTLLLQFAFSIND